MATALTAPAGRHTGRSGGTEFLRDLSFVPEARSGRGPGRRRPPGVVTAHEPDALLELQVDRQSPMLVRYELADAGDGATVAAIHATGEPGRFFGWATPLLRRQVQRSTSADLERLRVVLEN
jgi:hypothetical protein